MTGTRKSAKSAAVFSEEEREAMRQHAEEVKRARGKGPKVDGEEEVLAKIAEMGEPDRSMAARIHAIIRAAAPELAPRTWYGMPAYARDGRIVCFFQPASKFKVRYGTLGFNDAARLDDGNMWPVAYALPKLTAADEKRIAELVRKAAG